MCGGDWALEPLDLSPEGYFGRWVFNGVLGNRGLPPFDGIIRKQLDKGRNLQFSVPSGSKAQIQTQLKGFKPGEWVEVKLFTPLQASVATNGGHETMAWQPLPDAAPVGDTAQPVITGPSLSFTVTF